MDKLLRELLTMHIADLRTRGGDYDLGALDLLNSLLESRNVHLRELGQALLATDKKELALPLTSNLETTRKFAEIKAKIIELEEDLNKNDNMEE